ncbi:MAG TPA: aminopeptidase P family protein [Candidatus Faeciplasma gallinarum]|uniref:Aminopeptidase P family protein n=1 Tax=Candidatus Faeciplasma gallinarum TaxID=2840799 RepID=A0A9D1ENK8_9FIRM|nr:aminopeptidase P family protein [Candidatus Faeciplasma gallinarum]
MNKFERLFAVLPDEIDAAIITSDVNRRYFSGMKSSAGTVVAFRDKAYLIIDFRYIEAATKKVKDAQVILQGKLFDQINELLKKHGAKTAAIESDTMTVSMLNMYKERITAAEIVSSSALSDAIGELRIVKTQDEIDKMIKAQRIAEAAFENVLNFIKPGVTEKEIGLCLDYYMLKNGAEALSFDTIAITGANTSLPHGVPGDNVVKEGSFVLMDYGATYDGYHSDMTRTVCVGKPTEKMEQVYNIVLDAQLKTIAAIKEGITGHDADKVARDVITAAGYGEMFGHSLGHGVGMEIHEAPTAAPSSTRVLKENMIVTVEPGIYIPGEFGVRIEDFVIVKKDGCENMTLAKKSLISL